jgi:hypothetical protein
MDKKENMPTLAAQPGW